VIDRSENICDVTYENVPYIWRTSVVMDKLFSLVSESI